MFKGEERMMQLVLEDVGSPVTLSDGRWPVGEHPTLRIKYA